jgi:hypothetical protein
VGHGGLALALSPPSHPSHLPTTQANSALWPETGYDLKLDKNGKDGKNLKLASRRILSHGGGSVFDSLSYRKAEFYLS